MAVRPTVTIQPDLDPFRVAITRAITSVSGLWAYLRPLIKGRRAPLRVMAQQANRETRRSRGHVVGVRPPDRAMHTDYYRRSKARRKRGRK